MTNRKRILMLLENNSYPDDVRVALEANSLHEAEFSVTVICPTGDSKKLFAMIDGVRVYRYPCPIEFGGFLGYLFEYSYSLLATFLLTWWVYFRHGFDAIHSHTPPDIYVLIGRLFQCVGKKYVHDTHDLSPELYEAQRGGVGNSMVSKSLLWFERFACQSADRLIATNETQRDVQIDRCNAKPENCFIVRNGPSERFLNDVLPSQKYRSMEKLIIGYVGVIGVQDGVDCMIRMLKHLRYDLDRSDFHAVIVGTGTALDSLRALAAEIKVDEFVTFAGYLSGEELLQTIASFDIAITPDPSNPYNDSCTTIKTMEYMAMSKPTVAFDLPENRHSAGEAAVYAAANDEMALAKLTRDLMDDPEKRCVMGKTGRTRIEQELSWNHQKEDLVRVYTSLLHPTKNHSLAEAVSSQKS